MIVGGIRGGLIQIGLFALGVAIGLGYIYVSRPQQAELPQSRPDTRATENTRGMAFSSGNEAAASEGVEGPASIAFADSEARRTE